MDYQKTAREILRNIGGAENIVSAAHCATRLRLVLQDDQKVQKEAVEAVEGVKGVFSAQGQLQVIIGTGTVNHVYDALMSQAHLGGASKEEVKQAAASRLPWWKQAIKTLGDIFVPIIPAIVASGLLMGLLEGFGKAIPALAGSDFFQVISVFANAAFVFLPILIAVSAAKTFGGNPYLGAVIGMIMIHPALTNAWAVAGMLAKGETIPRVGAWFGLYQIDLIGYQGHVIPVIIAVLLMATIEKWLHKKVPAMIDLFVTPLVTVLVTGYITLTVIGPVFVTLENAVLKAAQGLVGLPFGLGAALAGTFYAPTVVAGLHHMYNALEAGLLAAKTNGNIWMPIATAANVAQGAAALAVALKAKQLKTKEVALPASLSAFLGITEPAIFGVNLRYGKPFLAGCIGGAAGAMVAGILHVSASAYGITGLFGVLITTHNLVAYLIVMAVAFAVAFAASHVLFREPRSSAENLSVQKSAPATPVVSEETAPTRITLSSPLTGELLPLSEVRDETFASGMVGRGLGFRPTENGIYAPCDGTVSVVFPTGHALAFTTAEGAQIMVHVGVNTVELEGKPFHIDCQVGQQVKAGERLGSFDLEEITAKGYLLDTPLLLVNPTEYADFQQIHATGPVQAGEAVWSFVPAKGEA